MANRLLPAPQAPKYVSLRRVLLIRPGGIGDALLLIPALAALKEHFPQIEITVLAERRNGAAFALCSVVDRLLLYDKPADLLRVLRGGYDLVIDTEQWHRLSAVVARLARAPLSIGFATNDRKRLFSHGICYSHDEYEVHSFFNLLQPLGILSPEYKVPFLVVPVEATDRAESLVAPLSGQRFVTLFPGASIPERRWGADRFRAVAEKLAKAGIPVVVVGGKDDAPDGERIADGLGINLAGRTSLAETAAVLARSAVLLSGDSGVLHIAVGLGVPTVSLFGPGILAKWGPKGVNNRVITKQLPCSPCTRFGTTPPCPIHARCLADITVTEVLGALRQLLR